MCKPAELDDGELVDLIAECMNELVERKLKFDGLLDKLSERFEVMKDWSKGEK